MKKVFLKIVLFTTFVLVAITDLNAANVIATQTFLCIQMDDVTDGTEPGNTVYCGGTLSWSGLSTSSITIYWYLDGAYIGGGVLSGISSTGSVSLYQGTGPTWAATAGSHTLRMMADPNNVISESNESDNSVSRSFTVAVTHFHVENPMATNRYSHRAVLLLNGKVLVAGGNNGNILGKSELYDPVTKAWTPTGVMNIPRQWHTATLLPNGKVLVAGGDDWVTLASAELYNPIPGTWTNTGAMIAKSYKHTATLLPNGTVLVTGGYGTDYLSRAEVYNPISGTWTNTGAMIYPRVSHTATLLSNGKVLVVGGANSTNSALLTTEVYDPATRKWTATGTLTTGRSGHTATLLSDGKVLVVGGYANANPSSTELYNPVTGVWTVTGPLNAGRNQHTATLLPNGKVLVAGGNNGSYPYTILSSAELYDPVTGTWASTGSLITTRCVHTATLLPNGKVLIAGGDNGMYSHTGLSSAELYDSLCGTATAVILNNTAKLPSGAFQFAFTNKPSVSFSVLAATNASLSLSNWTMLGGVIELWPGQYQFTDPQAPNSPQRFYRIRSP